MTSIHGQYTISLAVRVVFVATPSRVWFQRKGYFAMKELIPSKTKKYEGRALSEKNITVI